MVREYSSTPRYAYPDRSWRVLHNARVTAATPSGYQENTKKLQDLRFFFQIFRFQSELFVSKEKLIGFYLGPQIGHFFAQYEREREYSLYAPNNGINSTGNIFYRRLHRFNLTQNATSLCLKLGANIKLDPRVILDIYGGIGFSAVKITNDIPQELIDAQNISNQSRSFFINDSREDFSYIFKDKVSSSFIILRGGFMLGYLF